MAEGNPILYFINEARKYKMKEVRYYDNLVEKYENVEEIIEEFYEGLRDDIRTKASNGRTKYATYLMINPSLTKPTIYKNLKLHKHMSMVGKLRTSSHNLHIEMGRRTGKGRERRVCV